jgi:phosphatidylglycerol:prolipoprotein diacylglycerol transferase
LKIALLKFGPLGIHWYGLVIAAALVIGLVVSAFMARLREEPLEPLGGILLLGLLAGIIGARVWYFVLRRDFYAPDPGRVFAVWQGGLAWHGALLGGVMAAAIYTWNREIGFWTWADICAPGLILSQAIGRVGDLMNHQAFGTPSHGLWAVTIPAANRPPQYAAYSTFTNTAGYEAVWDLLVFGVLVGLTMLQLRRSRYLPVGSIFLAYLVLYSVARFPLEGLRVDSLWVMNMRVAQVASVVLIVIGGLTYAFQLLRGDQIPVAAPTAAAPVFQNAIAPGEAYLRPSEAYLIAATRAAHARQTSELPALTAAGNGHGVNGHEEAAHSSDTAVLAKPDVLVEEK